MKIVEKAKVMEESYIDIYFEHCENLKGCKLQINDIQSIEGVVYNIAYMVGYESFSQFQGMWPWFDVSLMDIWEIAYSNGIKDCDKKMGDEFEAKTHNELYALAAKLEYKKDNYDVIFWCFAIGVFLIFLGFLL